MKKMLDKVERTINELFHDYYYVYEKHTNVLNTRHTFCHFQVALVKTILKMSGDIGIG